VDADAVELRVLGCLLEKQRTTPDQYPLSLNALRLACNQSTNRDPIVDLGTTTIPHMTRILDDVDAALDAGGSVYVHCWGGIGRTGTVVGCWLVRHGLDGGDPLGRIAELRRDLSAAVVASPETSAQRAMVSAWKPGR
jgi:protein-tyrosine phosphatase